MPTERYFTLAEARAMLPRVSDLMDQLETQRIELSEVRGLLQSVQRATTGDGTSIQTDTAPIQQRMSRLLDGVRQTVSAITDLGVQVKDVERGLVDWPAMHQGREVLICWQRGEDEITWWHDLEAGFAGRRPILPEEWE